MDVPLATPLTVRTKSFADLNICFTPLRDGSRTGKLTAVSSYSPNPGIEVALIDALKQYFEFYNFERPHQSLEGKTSVEVYWGKSAALRVARSNQSLRHRRLLPHRYSCPSHNYRVFFNVNTMAIKIYTPFVIRTI